jgi:pimeloyl-ACP methyl ester carboxylesterase
MAVFVLVHGGGHGGWCWRKLIPLLRREGHEVYAPTMTGFGERIHLLDDSVDLETNVSDIAAVITYEDLWNVILVGHSYAGIVITGVADQVPERVSELVYLDANIPVNGESICDIRPDLTSSLYQDSSFVNGARVITRLDDPSGRICGVSDPDDLEWMRERMTYTPWNCVNQALSLSNESALDRIPRTNINTTERLGLLLPAAKERNLSADRVWEIDTGHDVMITEPEALATMLLQLVEVNSPATG